jgi:hypothetical protein
MTSLPYDQSLVRHGTRFRMRNPYGRQEIFITASDDTMSLAQRSRS